MVKTSICFDSLKARKAVDVCSNTIRAYHRQGLPWYKKGKAVFVSKLELRAFITAPVKKK